MTELQSTILCPVCGYAATETMPTNACVLAYECARCGTRPDTEEGRLLCLLLLWLGTMSADAEHKNLHRATRGKIKDAASAKPALSVVHCHRHHCVGGIVLRTENCRVLHATSALADRTVDHDLIRSLNSKLVTIATDRAVRPMSLVRGRFAWCRPAPQRVAAPRPRKRGHPLATRP
jgi:hypothetical protein